MPGAHRLKHVKESLAGKGGLADSTEISDCLFPAVAVDTSGTDHAPAPTVSIQDVDRVSRGEGQEVGAVSSAHRCFEAFSES